MSIENYDDLPFDENGKPNPKDYVVSEEVINRLHQESIESEKKMIKLVSEYENSISAMILSFFDDLMARNVSKKTIRTYKTHLNDFYNYIESFHNFDDDCKKYITDKVFKGYSVVLLYHKENFSQQSVLSYLRTIRAFFNWCFDNEYVSYFKIKMPTVQESVKNAYTDDELKLLLKKLNIKECDFTEYKVWVFENFLVSTGQRLGSCLNIKIKVMLRGIINNLKVILV